MSIALHHRSSEPAPAPSRLPILGASSVRVLVVEDNPVNRRVVQLMLEPFGFDLSFAENGLQGADACDHSRFDLVLMDLQMPVMDGLTAVRRIRAREAQRAPHRTAIAMLSANVGREHEMAAERAGADLYIAKPVTIDSLLEGIARALEVNQAGAQLIPFRAVG